MEKLEKFRDYMAGNWPWLILGALALYALVVLNTCSTLEALEERAKEVIEKADEAAAKEIKKKKRAR